VDQDIEIAHYLRLILLRPSHYGLGDPFQWDALTSIIFRRPDHEILPESAPRADRRVSPGHAINTCSPCVLEDVGQTSFRLGMVIMEREILVRRMVQQRTAGSCGEVHPVQSDPGTVARPVGDFMTGSERDLDI